jgi:hypothetical protein
MKFACPHCRKECDFMDIQLDQDLRAIIAMSDAFGRHRALVWAYAELFGVTPMRAKAKKLRLILAEMKALFDAGSFAYRKQRYQISADGVAEALNLVVHRHFADGLDSHNYLKKIMIGIADREARESGKQAERDLRGREGRLMAGLRGDDADDETRTDDPARLGRAPAAPYPVPEEQIAAPAMKSVPAADLTPEQIAENKRRIRALAESIGKKGES